MIQELRSHDIVPERMEAYLAWISQHGLPVAGRSARLVRQGLSAQGEPRVSSP